MSSAGRDADNTVVWLRGEHDSATVDTLSEAMARAITLDDADLVVDLRGVEFMSAATLGVIARTRGLLRLQSRSLVLRSPSKCARQLLDLCGFAGLVDPHLVDVTPLAGAATADRGGP